MADKPKVAFYWCASCGGCEESVVDLAEDVLTVVGLVDIVFWPVALDFKRKDVEAMADGSILASLVNGAIRTSEQEEMARLLRRKSKVLIAYGACSQSGGIPSLSNQFDRESILKFVYEGSSSTVNEVKTRPKLESGTNGMKVTLPELREVVRSLDQVVDVDYSIPGCAPTPKILMSALQVLLSGQLPPKGTVLAPDIALCDTCPRKDSKPEKLSLAEFRRPNRATPEPDKCILAQGFVCMGPATRGGCEALCVQGNMGCSGCFGPTSRVRDQGAKFLSAVTSSIAAKGEGEIDSTLAGIPDPVGTFYRYGLAKSLLRMKQRGSGKGN